MASIGLDPTRFGTHSQYGTKAVPVYRRTANATAAWTFEDGTVRYLASMSMTRSSRGEDGNLSVRRTTFRTGRYRRRLPRRRSHIARRQQMGMAQLCAAHRRCRCASSLLAPFEKSRRCSMTVGVGAIASSVARFSDSGQYRRRCGHAVSTPQASVGRARPHQALGRLDRGTHVRDVDAALGIPAVKAVRPGTRFL